MRQSQDYVFFLDKEKILKVTENKKIHQFNHMTWKSAAASLQMTNIITETSIFFFTCSNIPLA